MKLVGLNFILFFYLPTLSFSQENIFSTKYILNEIVEEIDSIFRSKDLSGGQDNNVIFLEFTSTGIDNNKPSMYVTQYIRDELINRKRDYKIYSHIQKSIKSSEEATNIRDEYTSIMKSLMPDQELTNPSKAKTKFSVFESFISNSQNHNVFTISGFINKNDDELEIGYYIIVLAENRAISGKPKLLFLQNEIRDLID